MIIIAKKSYLCALDCCRRTRQDPCEKERQELLEDSKEPGDVFIWKVSVCALLQLAPPHTWLRTSSEGWHEVKQRSLL